jgi:hypothetical protein
MRTLFAYGLMLACGVGALLLLPFWLLKRTFLDPREGPTLKW